MNHDHEAIIIVYAQYVILLLYDVCHSVRFLLLNIICFKITYMKYLFEYDTFLFYLFE